MGSPRATLNTQRLLKIDLSIREDVRGVLTDLEADGYRPLIDSAVWRSPEEQEAKFAAGVSKVRWGFHCASNPDGSPASLAADITDERWAWVLSPARETHEVQALRREFWLRLGAAALSHGLGWGGLWMRRPAGLSADQWVDLEVEQRDRLRAALRAHEWGYVGPLGFDPAHIETSRVTIAQAREGLR